MSYILRQIIRGFKTLPAVGLHPGIPVILLLIGWTVLVSISEQKFVILPVIFTLYFIGIFMWGAYTRACLSDKEVFKELTKEG